MLKIHGFVYGTILKNVQNERFNSFIKEQS